MNRDEVLALFSSNTADCRMLTFRSDDPKHQRIGYVADLCRKISDSYLVVRESNKRTAGWHFHAMLVCKKEPPPSWFKKGVHMRLDKIGRANNNAGYTIPVPDATALEIAETLHHCPELAPEVEQRMIDIAFAKHHKKQRLRTNKKKVCNYLFKEFSDDPVQFVDYILYHKKNHSIK